MNSYDDLFAVRGSAYDRAMKAFPDAREMEFRQALERVELVPGMVVADVPAGGGYLERYMPAGVRWMPHEPCASFVRHDADPGDPGNRHLLPLPWDDSTVDVAISIVGVHHLEDKRPNCTGS